MQKTITKKISIQIFTLIIFLFSTIPGQSQKGILTLEDIYVNHRYSTERYGDVKWYNNGDGYTLLEQSSDRKGRDIVLYQTKSGDKKVLVSSSMLIPQDADKPLTYNNYQFSKDGKHLMVFTNTRQVWRNHTRGDYWLLNIPTWKLIQLGRDLPPSSLMFAKFSPDSEHIAYVSEKNIYVEDVAGGNIEQLTHDGGNGTNLVD